MARTLRFPPGITATIAALLALLLPCLAHAADDGISPAPAPLENRSVGQAPPQAKERFSAALREFGSGRYREASAEAVEASGMSPGTPWEGRSVFLAARAYAAAGDMEAASTLFEVARDKYPALADYTFYIMAMGYSRAGKMEDTLSAYTRVYKDYPKSQLAGECIQNAAEASITLGRYADAMGILKPLMENKPSARTRYLMMKAYEGLGEMSGAAEQYRRLWLDYPDARETRDAGSLPGRLKEAGVEPPSFGFEDYLHRAERLADKCLYAPAEDNYRQAIKMMPEGEPRKGWAYFRLGVSYYRQREDALSEEALKAALSAESCIKDAPEALYWLARTYLREGDSGKFIDTALRCAFGYPAGDKAVDSLYLLGVYFSQEGEYDVAVELFRMLEETCPGSKRIDEALWQTGWASYKKGDYRASEAALGMLISRFPGSELVPQALYWRAKCFEAMDDRPSAALHYNELVSRHGLSFYGLLAGDGGTSLSAPVKAPPAPPPPAPREAYRDPQLARALELGIQGMKEAGLRELRRAEAGHAGSVEGLKEVEGLYAFLGGCNRPLELAAQLYKDEINSGSGNIPGEALEMAFPLGFWDKLTREASGFGLDPFLVSALIREESRFNPAAVSPAGAVGLMQLMPGTARLICRRLDMPYDSAERLKQEGFNLPLGACYLRELLDKHNGRVVYALAEYNAGPSNLLKWTRKMPDAPDDRFIEGIEYQETRNYVKRVLRNYYIYRMLYGE